MPLLVRLVVLLGLCVASDAHAQFPLLRVWPDDSFPCNGTLQQCIDFSSADDTIEVATNGPIDESLSIQDSISLVAAAGYQPVLAAGRNIIASAPGNDRYFWIEGFTLANGTIAVQNFIAGALGATVRNNRCRRILVQAQTGGPLLFDVSGNELTPAFSDGSAILVLAENAYGDGVVARNRVEMPPNEAAISVVVETGAMDVDIAANRVSGAFYETGIQVAKQGFTQSYHARVVNNLVTGATGLGWAINVAGQGETA